LAFSNQVLFVGSPTRPTPPSVNVPGSVNHQVGLLDSDGRLKWRLDVVSDFVSFVRCASAGEFAYVQISSPGQVMAFGTTVLKSTDYRSHYLIRLGPTGEILWTRKITRTGHELLPMAVDESGNCYLGLAGQILELESPILGNYQPAMPAAGYNLGFVKYSAAGELQWYTGLCRQSSPTIQSVIADGAGGCLFLESLPSQSSSAIGCQPFIHPPPEPATRYAMVSHLAAPPRLLIRRQGFEEEALVSILAEPGRSCSLETSSDLSRWTVLETMPLPRGVAERFVRLNSDNPGTFYRAVFADGP
jgi:hypothetical protein